MLKAYIKYFKRTFCLPAQVLLSALLVSLTCAAVYLSASRMPGFVLAAMKAGTLQDATRTSVKLSVARDDAIYSTVGNIILNIPRRTHGLVN